MMLAILGILLQLVGRQTVSAALFCRTLILKKFLDLKKRIHCIRIPKLRLDVGLAMRTDCKSLALVMDQNIYNLDIWQGKNPLRPIRMSSRYFQNPYLNSWEDSAKKVSSLELSEFSCSWAVLSGSWFFFFFHNFTTLNFVLLAELAISNCLWNIFFCTHFRFFCSMCFEYLVKDGSHLSISGEWWVA